MANLPDVVRRRIFHHLSLDDAKRGLDWRHGHFMPIGHFSTTKQKGDRDRLKFCLIYPEYVTKLNIDLNQVKLTFFLVNFKKISKLEKP